MSKITVAFGIGPLKTSLRCKERLFEGIPCGLEPLKTTLTGVEIRTFPFSGHF